MPWRTILQRILTLSTNTVLDLQWCSMRANPWWVGADVLTSIVMFTVSTYIWPHAGATTSIVSCLTWHRRTYIIHTLFYSYTNVSVVLSGSLRYKYTLHYMNTLVSVWNNLLLLLLPKQRHETSIKTHSEYSQCYHVQQRHSSHIVRTKYWTEQFDFPHHSFVQGHRSKDLLRHCERGRANTLSCLSNWQ